MSLKKKNLRPLSWWLTQQIRLLQMALKLNSPSTLVKWLIWLMRSFKMWKRLLPRALSSWSKKTRLRLTRLARSYLSLMIWEKNSFIRLLTRLKRRSVELIERWMTSSKDWRKSRRGMKLLKLGQELFNKLMTNSTDPTPITKSFRPSPCSWWISARSRFKTLPSN